MKKKSAINLVGIFTVLAGGLFTVFLIKGIF